MSTLAEIKPVKAKHIRLELSLFYVELEDGREIGVPYSWFWRLAGATKEQFWANGVSLVKAPVFTGKNSMKTFR